MLGRHKLVYLLWLQQQIFIILLMLLGNETHAILQQQQQQRRHEFLLNNNNNNNNSSNLMLSSDIVEQFILTNDDDNDNDNDHYNKNNGDKSTTTTTTTSTQNNHLNNITITTTNYYNNNNNNNRLLYRNYFQHLTYDAKNNKFYAGATNKLLQLNDNLKLLQQTITGPKYDSPQCHASGCPEDVETTLVNNYNKILILSYALDQDGILIACGSVRQGACEKYNVSGFPNDAQFIGIPLAANDELGSTYAFVGPAQYTWKKEDILYVGTTFTNNGDYRHDVPAISSRRLDDLNYVEFSIQQSIINIDVKYRDHFLVDYVYGFNSSDYAYFVLVQKKSHLADEAGYITRLARICITDPNYDSYTEITLQCLAPPDNRDYNILRDAKIMTAGGKLAAQMGIKRNDNVLVTVFSPSKEISNQVEAKSAMCLYSLKDIEDIFIENIHMCFNGTIKDRNLGYISGTINDGRCPLVGSLGNIFNFCTVGLKISGVAPISAEALFHFDNVSITSITTTTTGQHSLAFLGTDHGTIKKVLISGNQPGEYEEIIVDPGHSILQDTMMSPKRDFLYVLSKRKITKLRLEHCSIYTNCSSCLESRDPFCGWCSLEKRCTVRSTCQKDTSAARWLSLGTGQQCIDFESIIPDKIPIGELSRVHLIIRTLPEPHNAKYRCVFGNSTPIDAVMNDTGLSCFTPPIEERPYIASGMDHVLVPLSVRSSETNKDFVSRSFAFYDCSRHSTCQSCLASVWGCGWCIYDNRCINRMEKCRNMEMVISSLDVCPHLKQTNRQNLLLLPVRVPKEIRLEIEHLPKPKSVHSGFLCIVQIEDAQMLLPARVDDGRYVVCEKTPYFYETNSHEYEAKVDIMWNRQHYIDTATITLYKCDILGSHREHADCSLCVTRDIKYQCAWCNNLCVYNETCATNKIIDENRQVYNECPRPRIDIIKPLSGPIEGGTLVTIEGSNLGIREEDVRGKISLGDVPCELVRYEISVKIECRTHAAGQELSVPLKVSNGAGYTESSVQFHFKDIQLTGLYPTVGPKSGGTQISIMGKYLNIGSNIRAFLDEYECAINMTQASSSQLTCTTSEATQPEPIRTLRLLVDGANRSFTCQQNFNYNYNQLCSIFNYTQDARIMQIKPLRSFVSGGRVLTVHGLHLDSIQKPELEVYYSGERINKTACRVINSNQMECPTPAINEKFTTYKQQLQRATDEQMGPLTTTAYLTNVNELTTLHNYNNMLTKRSLDEQYKKYAVNGEMEKLTTLENYHNMLTKRSLDNYAEIDDEMEDKPVVNLNVSPSSLVKLRETELNLQLAFVMDNVKWVRDLSKYFPNIRSNMVYVDDPIYYKFPPPGIKAYKGDTLVIEGEFLNIAADEYDVNVTIGVAQCNITSLALTQLVCIPPLVGGQPASTDEHGVEQTEVDLPLVVVRIGKNLRFPLGYLRYELQDNFTYGQAIWAIIFTIVVIILLLMVILFLYRRKSTQAEREYKRIQIQMITLESNVRSECKQAFAELQTDMTDLTADLENAGIPTLDHVNYIMKVFFPGVNDHPTLNSPKLHMNSVHTNYDAAMLQFEQLLSNKYFVLTFIETLESQRTFNIRDKVNVASLLMIVLMNKMEYATEILKCLLMRLVEKSVVGKNPHMMLRRTESVVEKMLTNYMAICMYDYLKEYAGASLFLMFKAIKHQIEKGLVDAITHEARYSLSEERLLHEQITHHSVVLHIVQDDLDEKVICKVLDKDTISQVKGKILDALFRNTPFSMRPSVHEVDLEWRHGRGGHLTLQDEDLTTKTVNGWRQLNTLEHYGVKESAVMSLIARQNDNYNMMMNYNNHHQQQQQRHHHNHHQQQQQQHQQQQLLNHHGHHHQPSNYNNSFYSMNNSQSHMIINNEMMLDMPGNSSSGSMQQQQQQQQQQQHGHNYQSHVYHLVKPSLIPDHYMNMKNNAMSTTTIPQYMASSSSSHHQTAAHNVDNHHHNFTTTTNNNYGHKTIPEVYLTRLLAAKGTIQKFVDDFFATILTVNEELPPAVKWLFDLLDEAARQHGIINVEIVHAWKSNSLPLRFWINFIKNPDYIFDVNKTITVDACLSVIAQTFMDSCSTSEHRLGKDSPSNKLLFAKDIPQYRKMVKQFYRDVARLPQISDQEMNTAMQQLSIQQQNDEFDTIAALKELYIYVTKYHHQLMGALESDVNCKKMHLSHKLKNVACTLDGDATSAC